MTCVQECFFKQFTEIYVRIVLLLIYTEIRSACVSWLRKNVCTKWSTHEWQPYLEAVCKMCLLKNWKKSILCLSFYCSNVQHKSVTWCVSEFKLIFNTLSHGLFKRWATWTVSVCMVRWSVWPSQSTRRCSSLGRVRRTRAWPKTSVGARCTASKSPAPRTSRTSSPPPPPCTSQISREWLENTHTWGTKGQIQHVTKNTWFGQMLQRPNFTGLIT